PVPGVRPPADILMDAGDRLAFLARPPGPAFSLRQITVAVGAEQVYDAAEWRGALVVVERGAIELESRSGARRTFVGGAVLCLDRLSLRALRNPGEVPALISAVSRRR